MEKEIVPTKKQAELTLKRIRYIAELRIKALGLHCTVDEYLKKCQDNKKQG